MGGAAFKDKARRINKEEIIPTLKWIAYKTGLGYPYLINNMMGSAGKSETSGDIDINMDQTKYDKRALLNKLVNVLGPDDVKDWTHVNQIFTCIPITGDPAHGYVQVDFMFGNHAWQAFSYHSPGPTSQYKGLFRTELIKAAVAFNSDWTLMENDELVARVGPTFFHDKGLVWRYRHRAPRKDGKGRVKTLSELTEAEFLQMYPDAKKASALIVDSPKGVAELIFGSDKTLQAFDRYETLSEKLKTFYGRNSYGTIMEIFEERLNSLKVDIPKDIIDEILAATRAAG